MKREHAYKLRELLHKASASLTDAEALDGIELFPLWAAGAVYETGIRVRYEDRLYRCVQAHTSQEGWEPPTVPALWAEVARPGEIPVWRQPAGAQDAYSLGDLVHYPDADGPVYRSAADSNVWSPAAWPDGWTLMT